MFDLKDELKYCYRVDRYIVHDPRAKKDDIEEFEEYYLVAGEHSVIKVKDFDYGYCTVQTHGIIFNMVIDPYMEIEEDICDLIDKFQTMVMVYDYVVSELKKNEQKRGCALPAF